jgi:Ca2+-binding EF-hand superfamily protein
MLSDFQKSKLDRRFELVDADGDGYITASDYDAMAARVCEAFGHPAGSPAYERVHMAFLNLWVRLSKKMDRAYTGRISRRQFVSSCADSLVEHEGGYERVIAPLVRGIFEIADADQDGALDIQELTTWFNAYGVCADDAERAFRRLDRNGDGLLDRDEVQQAVKEYYTGDDPAAPGSAIYGPLPVPARMAAPKPHAAQAKANPAKNHGKSTAAKLK